MTTNDILDLSVDPAEWVVIGAGAQLELGTCPALRIDLLDAIADGQRWVILDLEGAEEVDSAAMTVVTNAQRRLRAMDGEVRVVTRSAPILALLRTTGLDRVLPVFESVDSARGVPEQRQG